jgi:hypothetical protein
LTSFRREKTRAKQPIQERLVGAFAAILLVNPAFRISASACFTCARNASASSTQDRR